MLKIERYLDYYDNISQIDFTLLGLIKAEPEYDKGRKIEACYFADEAETDLVVKKTFTDRFDTVETTKLIGLDIHFDWYNEDETIGLTKNQYKPLGTTEGGNMQRKRRERAIDYLVLGAIGTPAEPLVSAIFAHYQVQTDRFIAVGSNDLHTDVNAEIDSTILGYLNTVVYVDTGETIKDRINYVIT